jgi:hypothetical protein
MKNMSYLDARARREALEMHVAMLQMSLHGIECYHKDSGENNYETLERKVTEDLSRARKDSVRAHLAMKRAFYSFTDKSFMDMDLDEWAQM